MQSPFDELADKVCIDHPSEIDTSYERAQELVARLRCGRAILGPPVPCSARVHVVRPIQNVSVAFAMPGNVFLTDLTFHLSDAGLAFILGHELGHVAENHTPRLKGMFWLDRHREELRADLLADRWCRAADFPCGATDALTWFASDAWQSPHRLRLLFARAGEGMVAHWLRRRRVSHPTIVERALRLGVTLPRLEPTFRWSKSPTKWPG